METLQPKLRFSEFNGDWQKNKLGEVSTNKSGKYNPLKESKYIKCIELEHLSSDSGQLLGYIDGSNSGSIKNKFDKGDVLFGKLRPYLKKYLLAPFAGVCTSEIWVLKGIKISNQFLYSIVQTETFIDIANQSSGSKMPRADWNVVSNYEINYPSIEEQTRISNFLSAVDEKLNLLKEKKTLLEEYKKGIMQKIFNQEIRFKDDNGNDFGDWEEILISDLTNIIVGGTPSTTKEEYWNGNIAWLSSGELNNGLVTKARKHITEIGLKNSSAKIMKPNTVMLAMTGATLGKIGYLTFESTGNQSIAGFEPNNKYVSKFFYYNILFNKNLILSMAGGAAQQGINKASIESLFFTFPNLKEQTKIANFISAIDEKIELVSNQIQDTQDYKKGLLQQMFV